MDRLLAADISDAWALAWRLGRLIAAGCRCSSRCPSKEMTMRLIGMLDSPYVRRTAIAL
jgi:hypothetical protein